VSRFSVSIRGMVSRKSKHKRTRQLLLSAMYEVEVVKKPEPPKDHVDKVREIRDLVRPHEHVCPQCGLVDACREDVREIREGWRHVYEEPEESGEMVEKIWHNWLAWIDYGCEPRGWRISQCEECHLGIIHELALERLARS
jgi:hypothetical protein